MHTEIRYATMNKRIKTVWVLSIATMVLILCGQAYWLTNQYKLVTDIHIEQLKTACTEAIDKEQQWRYETMERGDTLENKIRKTYTIKFDCKKTSREADGKQVSSCVTFTLPGKRQEGY